MTSYNTGIDDDLFNEISGKTTENITFNNIKFTDYYDWLNYVDENIYYANGYYQFVIITDKYKEIPCFRDFNKLMVYLHFVVHMEKKLKRQ